MDSPLWIDQHRPSLDELPQPEARAYLTSVPRGPVNLLLHGPAGSGKTAAVVALADELHADPANDLQIINVADFFAMTKREIIDDPRFSRFLDASRRRDSKGRLINYVLKEMAGYPPVSGEFKTILLDNAEGMREDFQQALRRVMEQHYEATQFVITTRQPGALIPPIRSRCAQVPIRAPTSGEIVSVLEAICEREAVSATEDGLSYIAGYADGDLRRAILAAQTTARAHDEITMSTAYEVLDTVGNDDQVKTALDYALAGEFSDARGVLDDLLIEGGYEGSELLSEFLRVARNSYDPRVITELTELAGEVDVDVNRGRSDRVHLAHFLARLGTDAPYRRSTDT